MPSTTFIILNYVCPSLGTILASATFSAPVSSLKKALSAGNLGDLNPTPWAFMTGNCLGWIAYSFITNDLFVLSANAPGFILSIWLNNGASKLQYQELCQISRRQADCSNNKADNLEDSPLRNGDDFSATDQLDRRTLILPSLTAHEYWVLGIFFIWTTILSAIIFVPTSTEVKQQVIGLCVNINLIIFYGAPLSTIAMVLRTMDSSSIHRRTLAMTLLNSFFWGSYGVGVMDMWILVPNLCGVILGLIQLMLCCIFSRTADDDESAGENSGGRIELLVNEDDVESLRIV
mmetsp:Transcript_11238/g.13298  ORF Transcript_11238/g.13298 Transcript_11238/m.13298 type:complete len:290 (-) Transcript_11238:246-1115(-)